MSNIYKFIWQFSDLLQFIKLKYVNLVFFSPGSNDKHDKRVCKCVTSPPRHHLTTILYIGIKFIEFLKLDFILSQILCSNNITHSFIIFTLPFSLLYSLHYLISLILLEHKIFRLKFNLTNKLICFKLRIHLFIYKI